MPAVMLHLISDAEIKKLYDDTFETMYAANHTNPRTAVTMAKAKGLLIRLKMITTEMRRRSDNALGIVAVGDAVIKGVSDVSTGVSKAVAGIGSGLIVAFALAGFVLYQLKK